MAGTEDKKYKEKSSKTTEIILIMLIVLVLGLCAFMMFKLFKSDKQPAEPTATIAVTQKPEESDETEATATPEVTDEPTAENTEKPTAEPTPTTAPTPTPTTTPEPTATPQQETLELVDYTGRVEHIFTHSLIAYPELCFSCSNEEKVTSTYFLDCITVKEFKATLEALYNDGYMLINLNECFDSVETSEDGKTITIVKPIKFPKGKKPLVLSFDDVNYYSKKAGKGFVDKIVIKNGKIMTYTKMSDGSAYYADDNEHIVILDKFVEEHPDFSYNGAKGMLCVTGFEGVLGYRVYRILTEGDPNDPLSLRTEETRQAEIEAVKPVVAMLKETGWYFGCHSYKHGDMYSYTREDMIDDAEKFKNEITPIIGETKIYIFPYGSWQPSTEEGVVPPAQQVLIEYGFEYYCGVGMDWFVKIMNGTGSQKWYLGGIIFQDRVSLDGKSMVKYKDKFLKTSDGVDRFKSLDTEAIWDEEARGISYAEAYRLIMGE